MIDNKQQWNWFLKVKVKLEINMCFIHSIGTQLSFQTKSKRYFLNKIVHMVSISIKLDPSMFFYPSGFWICWFIQIELDKIRTKFGF